MICGILIPELNRNDGICLQVHDVSRAVNAIDALLRPLEWPFTFVPVLPDSILEICDVPAPYLMGVLRYFLLFNFREYLLLISGITGGFHLALPYVCKIA